MDEPGRPVELLVDNCRTRAQCWRHEHQQLVTFQRDGLDVVIGARDWDNLLDTALARIFDRIRT